MFHQSFRFPSFPRLDASERVGLFFGGAAFVLGVSAAVVAHILYGALA